MKSLISRFMALTMIISFPGLTQGVRAQSWLDVVGEASMNYATSSYMPWDPAHPNNALAYKGAGTLGATLGTRSTLTPAVPAATASEARRVDVGIESAGQNKKVVPANKPTTSAPKKVSTVPTSSYPGMKMTDYERAKLEMDKQVASENANFQKQLLANQQTGLFLQATQTKLQATQLGAQGRQIEKAGRLNDLTELNVAANWTGVGIAGLNTALNQIPWNKAFSIAGGLIGKRGEGLTVPRQDPTDVRVQGK